MSPSLSVFDPLRGKEVLDLSGLAPAAACHHFEAMMRTGNLPDARTLVHSHREKDWVDALGFPLFIKAVYQEREDFVTLLVEEGWDMRIFSRREGQDGYNALQWVCGRTGSASMLQHLIGLGKGKELSLGATPGLDALSLAVIQDRMDLVGLLLDAGLGLREASWAFGKAVSVEMLEFLEGRGFSLAESALLENLEECGSPAVSRWMVEKGAPLNEPNRSALALACQMGEAGLVRPMLEKGADPNGCFRGLSPLYRLVFSEEYIRCDEKALEMAGLLLAAGASEEASNAGAFLEEIIDRLAQGYRVHSFEKVRPMMDLLVMHGFCPFQRKNVLCWVIDNIGTGQNRPGLVRWLLEQGADPEYIGRRGLNAMGYACERPGKTEVAEVLFENNPTRENLDGLIKNACIGGESSLLEAHFSAWIRWYGQDACATLWSLAAEHQAWPSLVFLAPHLQDGEGSMPASLLEFALVKSMESPGGYEYRKRMDLLSFLLSLADDRLQQGIEEILLEKLDSAVFPEGTDKAVLEGMIRTTFESARLQQVFPNACGEGKTIRI